MCRSENEIVTTIEEKRDALELFCLCFQLCVILIFILLDKKQASFASFSIQLILSRPTSVAFFTSVKEDGKRMKGFFQRDQSLMCIRSKTETIFYLPLCAVSFFKPYASFARSSCYALYLFTLSFFA